MNKPLLLFVFILAVISIATLIKLQPLISLFQTEQLNEIVQDEHNNPPAVTITQEEETRVTHGTVLSNIDEESIKVVSKVVKEGLASQGSDEFSKFRTLQRNIATTLAVPSEKRRSMSVLVASSVSSRVAAVAQFTEWVKFFNTSSERQIEEFGIGDKFEFALNHYDNDTSNWYAIVCKPYLFFFVMS